MFCTLFRLSRLAIIILAGLSHIANIATFIDGLLIVVVLILVLVMIQILFVLIDST